MFEIKLCQTQDYPPSQIEHWLSTLQGNREKYEVMWQENQGRVRFYSNENLESIFYGSRALPTSLPPRTGTFHVAHANTWLLPIKRHSQFEDLANRIRNHPSDTLIHDLAKLPRSHLQIHFTPLPNRLRRAALRKVKKDCFHLEKSWDQWESRGWNRLSFRRFLGPLLRRLRYRQEPNSVQENTQTRHERENALPACLDKLSRPLFKVQIQMSHPFNTFFQGFSLPYLGQLEICKKPANLILSAEELATLLAPPHPEQCKSLVDWEPCLYLKEPPLETPQLQDLTRHHYLLGKTGMGKSTLLLQEFQQRVQEGHCAILLDPHGDLVNDALQLIPSARQKDVVFLDPANAEFPPALNPLANKDHPHLVCAALIEVFRLMSQGSWGPRLEYILRNSLLTLLHCPNSTLLDLPRLLTQRHESHLMLKHVDDPELLRFWIQEFWSLDDKTRKEHIAPILNKVGPLLTTPLLRNILGQPQSRFNFKTAFNKNQIVLIPLAKGRLGDDLSRFLGLLLLVMIQSELFSRATLPPDQRSLVCLTLDEFQNFATSTLAEMLAESRKYGLALTLANQYLTQLPPEIQDAVLGNVGSLSIFRCSFNDAKVLAPPLHLIETDLMQIPPFSAYAMWMRQGQTLPLFRLETTPLKPVNALNIQAIRTRSQHLCGRPKAFVEERLGSRYTKGTSNIE